MVSFPFTSDEWEPLKGLALSIVNAQSAEDEVLAGSLTIQLLDHLDTLRARHGDHPVLLETAADFTPDPSDQAGLYRRAIELAGKYGLPTLSIRLSFAPVLVELGEPIAALAELQACGGEVARGSADEPEQWLRELENVARKATHDGQQGYLFQRAAEIAEMHGQPAHRIRLFLARFLLDEGDEKDRACWAKMIDEAGRAEPNS